MKCIEKIKIYKGEYGFSTSFPIKEKNKSGEYEITGNEYLTLQFTNDNEPKMKRGETLEINLIDSFIATWKSKDGEKSGLKLIVLDYNMIKPKRK